MTSLSSTRVHPWLGADYRPRENAAPGTPCPNCGFNPRFVENFAFVWRKISWSKTRTRGKDRYADKYNQHGKGTLCPCREYVFTYGDLIERRERVGRPRLGKTHQRSQHGKLRQNLRRNKKRKASKKVKIFTTVEDGKLLVKKSRPNKATILIREMDVHPIVAQAIKNCYSLPVVKPARKPKASKLRTPRKRTRSEQIERLQKLLEAIPFDDVKRYNAVNERLEEEYLLQARRDVRENLNKEFIWSDSAESVYAERWRKRQGEDGSEPSKIKYKRYGMYFDDH